MIFTVRRDRMWRLIARLTLAMGAAPVGLAAAVTTQSQEDADAPVFHHGQGKFAGFENHPTPPHVTALNSLLADLYAQTRRGSSAAETIPTKVRSEFDRLNLRQKIEFATFRNRMEHPPGARWIRAIVATERSDIEIVLAGMFAGEPSDDFACALLDLVRTLSVVVDLRPNPEFITALRQRVSKLPVTLRGHHESEAEEIISRAQHN